MNAVDELNFLLGIGPPRPTLPLTLQRSGYASIRALGKGSFGQALLVFHKGRNRYYAVKHVNMTSMSTRQRKDAHQEIAVLQQLYHPNIVRYVEYFEEHPHLYIVMEYADGGDLYTHLQKISRLAAFGGGGGGGASSASAGAAAAAIALRRGIASNNSVSSVTTTMAAKGGLLSEAQVISLFVQTTMAVKHMHDRRLLHRDIKSQNVFLTRTHVVKLGDFGITTVLQNTVAMASTMCGTPCYFSPELCQGQPYNNKSDVWALGVLLYEMCAITLPFESTTMKALMREIVSKSPKRIPSCFSDELWSLVLCMIEKDPRRRPDAGQVLLQPVLMRRVPDIIAQLKSVEFSDISPRARDKQSGGGNKGGGGNDADVFVADTEPYQQLLAHQQGLGGGGGGKGAGGEVARSPFAGALAPGAPISDDPHSGGGGGGGYAQGLGVRPNNINKAPDPVANPQQQRGRPPSPPRREVGVAPAPAAAAAPQLTPGQRAAQAVMRKGGGGGGGGAQPPANSNRNTNTKASPISELLAKFDAEKKRIQDGKHASSSGDTATAVGGGGQAVPAVVARHQQQPPAPPPLLNPGAVLSAAADHSDSNSVDRAKEKRRLSGELGDMLAEMTGYFHRFKSVQMLAKDGEAIILPGPPPPPGPPSRSQPPQPHLHSKPSAGNHAGDGADAVNGDNKKSSGAAAAAIAAIIGCGAKMVARPVSGATQPESTTTAAPIPAPAAGARLTAAAASDFVDPAGAGLDLAALEHHTQPTRSNSSVANSNNGTIGKSNAASGRGAVIEKLFATSFNKAFDQSAKARGRSPPAPSRTSSSSPSAGVAVPPPSPDPPATKNPRVAMGNASTPAAAAANSNKINGCNGVGDGDGDDGHEEEETFTAACLCGGVSLCGPLNTIFGSFICSCAACERACGSGGDVEWFHIPNVPAVSQLTGSKSSAAAVAGGGAAAASALRSGGGVGVVAVGGGAPATATTAASTFAFTMVIVDDDDDNDGDGDGCEKKASGGGGVGAPSSSGGGTFLKHFCAHCGCTVAFQHHDLEGLLLPRSVLSDASIELLERFAIGPAGDDDE